jgi:tetratricopeptide (TPR) repeat protein
MLALYRSGRQSEALRHYEVVRRGLADELGADPTPALQALHKGILASDSTLSIVEPRSPVPVVPRQLPAAPRHFTGRARELECLGSAGPIIAISGMAGVGKTALALHWAHAARDRFPDGQLYVNLRGFGPDVNVMTPAEVIRGFLDTLGVTRGRLPTGLDAQAGLYRSLIAGRRMLIVLDNARDADQVRPLLPGTDSCLVMVTSRDRLTGLIATAGAQPLTVELFSKADAHTMLAAAVGERRFRAEPEAVDEIVRRCAGLPLALSVVAARAAANPDFPLGALAQELSEADGVSPLLDAFDGGDLASDARAVFSWSTQALSPSAARMFRCLAGHPGPDMTLAVAASAAGLRLGRARVLLEELCRAHLVMQSTPDRYYLHDLLRVYAEEQAVLHDTMEERLATLHRGLDHYLHSAYACAELLHTCREPIAIGEPLRGVTPESPADSADALAWFRAEHNVLLCCVKAAIGTGLDGYVWRLAWTMWAYLDRQGHWRDLLTVGRAGLADAVKIGHVRGQTACHRLLGAAFLRLGWSRRAQSHLRYALELCRQVGDVAGEAGTHHDMAIVCEASGRHAEALAHAQQSLALQRIAGDRQGSRFSSAQALSAVGWYHALLGRHDEALEHGREALTAIEELDDVVTEALTWNTLGYAYHHLGEHAEAIACYETAIGKHSDLGDRYDKAMSLKRLGEVHADCGQEDKARERWIDALSILEELAHPDANPVRERLRQLAGARTF